MGTDKGDDGDEELRDIYGPGEEPEAPPTVEQPVVSWDAAADEEPPPPPAAPVADDDGPGRVHPLVGTLIIVAVLAALLGLFLATKDDDDALTAEPATATTFDYQPLGTTTTAPSTTTTLGLTVEDASATTVTTAVATTVARTGGRCPTSVGSSVDRFAWEQESPGSDVYRLDVRGTVTNPGGGAIRVSSVEIAVLRGGAQVATVSVPADRTVGGGEVMEYFRDGAPVTIPGGAPDAARISSVPYTCV